MVRPPSDLPQLLRAIPQPDGSFRWRLLAPNGRTLGVSADSFPDLEATWREVVAASHSAVKLVPSYGHPRAELGWIWSAAYPDGQPVAAGARSYERRATCVFGFQRFVAVLAELATTG